MTPRTAVPQKPLKKSASTGLVLLATVLLCVITGVLGCLEVYAGQLIWPDYQTFPDPDTAFVSAAGRAGGDIMFHVMNFTLLVATMGSSLGAQVGAVRLLYAMGRDNAIPRGFFGYLDPVRNTPRYNILLTGAICVIGAMLISYQVGAELVNFGAFVAFMGVNLAAIRRYYLRGKSRGLKSILLNLRPPLAGVVVCAYIWWSLRMPAKVVGFCWLFLGLIYYLWRTRFFRTRIDQFQFQFFGRRAQFLVSGLHLLTGRVHLFLSVFELLESRLQASA